MIARYGADATRMYALFAAPPDRDLEWQEEGVGGSQPVSEPGVPADDEVRGMQLRAVKSLASQTMRDRSLLRKLHQTIAKITQDFSGRWHFNTCIAAIMESGERDSGGEAAMDAGEIPTATVSRRCFASLVLMLAPFAPFLAAELWEEIGGKGQVFRARWPVADAELGAGEMRWRFRCR